MTPLLDARGVAVPGRLAPTDLAVAPGELVALIGPNGSGKTSLLRALAGIEGSGAVTVDGEALRDAAPARRRRLMAFLPASRELAWPLPVRDVIALGLDRPDPERVEALLGALRLAPLAERAVDRLSTGERARALLGRALAPVPKLLLLDEPLSNLDPAWSLRILALLRAVAEDGAAVLVAVHDLSLLGGFDRAVMLGDGRIAADGAPGAVLASEAFADLFEVSPAQRGGWRLSRSADRRSSP